MSTATPTSPSFRASVTLVAGREITMRLRSRSFLISTGILLLAVLASIVVGSIFANNQEPPKVAVESSVTGEVPESATFQQTVVDSRAEAEKLVRDGTVDAAIVASTSADDGGENTLGVTVVGLDSVPTDIVSAVSTPPAVSVLDPTSQNEGIIFLVGLGFGLVFFSSAVTFGSVIAQSVVEEKQTRIVEILMSTVTVRTLLAGKVIGNSILALAQIAIIALLAGIGLLVTGQSALFSALGPSIGWFIVFFAIGFVLLAAMFAAAASLVSRQEDMATVTTPVTMLVMAPYFLVIFFSDNPIVLAIMSYVPFSAPVGMPMRVFLGIAEWWEPLLSLVILLLSAAAVIVLGARIYSNSVLRMGGRVKLGEALAR